MMIEECIKCQSLDIQKIVIKKHNIFVCSNCRKCMLYCISHPVEDMALKQDYIPRLLIEGVSIQGICRSLNLPPHIVLDTSLDIDTLDNRKKKKVQKVFNDFIDSLSVDNCQVYIKNKEENSILNSIQTVHYTYEEENDMILCAIITDDYNSAIEKLLLETPNILKTYALQHKMANKTNY